MPQPLEVRLDGLGEAQAVAAVLAACRPPRRRAPPRARSRSPGRARASRLDQGAPTPASPSRSISRISIRPPPPARRPKSRAGITRVSLSTSRSPGPQQARQVAHPGMPLGAVAVEHQQAALAARRGLLGDARRRQVVVEVAGQHRRALDDRDLAQHAARHRRGRPASGRRRSRTARRRRRAPKTRCRPTGPRMRARAPKERERPIVLPCDRSSVRRLSSPRLDGLWMPCRRRAAAGSRKSQRATPAGWIAGVSGSEGEPHRHQDDAGEDQRALAEALDQPAQQPALDHHQHHADEDEEPRGLAACRSRSAPGRRGRASSPSSRSRTSPGRRATIRPRSGASRQTARRSERSSHEPRAPRPRAQLGRERLRQAEEREQTG